MSKSKLNLILYFIFLASFAGCGPSLTEEERGVVARQIVDNLTLMTGPPHEYRPVQIEDIPLMDMDFYKEMTDLFNANGFKWLGDIEDVTVSQKNPYMITGIRLFSGDEGQILGAIYYLRKSRHLPDGLKIVELETEFSNGGFISTTNNSESTKLTSPPEIHVMSMGFANLKNQLKTHRERLREYQTNNPGTKPVEISNQENALLMQNRMQLTKSRYRRALKGLTLEELTAINKDLPRRELKKLIKKINEFYEMENR